MIGKKITLKKSIRVYSTYTTCFASLTDNLDFCTELSSCKEYVLDSYYHALSNDHPYWDTYSRDREVFYKKCGIEPFLVAIQAESHDKAIQSIGSMEKRWGFEPSVFHPTNHSNIFAAKISSGWLFSPPLLSFFLLAFRHAVTEEKFQDPAEWVFSSWPLLNRGTAARYQKFIQSDDPRKFFFPTHKENWNAMAPLVKEDMRFIHDKSGIYGLIARYIPIREWNERLEGSNVI